MPINFRKIPDIIYIILITAILVSTFSVKSYYTGENANLVDFKPISVIDKAQLTYKGKDSYINLPTLLDVTDVFELKINISGEGNLPEKSIGLFIGYCDVDVIVDGKVIYRDHVDNKNFTYSGGYPYRIIKIPQNITTPIVKIKVKPRLKLVHTYTIRPIEIGKKANFYTYLMKDGFVGMTISAILLFIFFISTLMYLISAMLKSKISKLYNVGLISLFGGVYSLTSFKVMSYLFSPNIEFLYFIEYTSLLLLPYPMLKILESGANEKGKKILFWIKNIVVINYISQVIMTFLGIFVFKDILIFSHIIICSSMIGGIGVLFISNNNKKSRRGIAIIFSTYIFLSLLFVIITFKGNGQYTMYGFILWGFIFFIIFQIAQGTISYIQSKNENARTNLYKKYIYQDIMTGLQSRFAFEEKMKEIKNSPIDATIISCDLNDLKKVNDTMGHVYGDAMIKKAGDVLKNYFRGANVYRTGGDEYVVISEKILEDSYVENFKYREFFIEISEERVLVKISIGKCDVYHDGEINIYEAFKIADEKMYEDKVAYKNKTNTSLRYS
ncbi:diguanylate cyclase (GGDEF) domain protein [[Eubacterium] yurii subsp. margaretiae ATCC 43715]|nr:diguanylate cyclase (GGDEF) domain protein [[Eubacterium] yurii subsp. margaretiae ATCC 43715]